MTTISSFRRSAFLALMLGAAGATATFAQTTPTTTPTTTPPADSDGWKHHHHHHSDLTADEKAQLKKAHDAALAADPTLASQKEALKEKFKALKAQGANASKADWAALHAQHEDLHTKMRAAELKADPSLGPIFTKLDAEKHHHEHHSAT